MREFDYLVLVLITAIIYTASCIIGHHIWKLQDKKQLRTLIQKKEQLEKELSL